MLERLNMKPENFCYWLQGYFEISGSDDQPLTSQQVEQIKNHLSLVLDKKTPVVDPFKFTANPFYMNYELTPTKSYTQAPC